MYNTIRHKYATVNSIIYYIYIKHGMWLSGARARSLSRSA